MSNTAAYTIGQLVKLIEGAAPDGLRVFVNVVTARTLADTVGIIGMQWLDKCRKQMNTKGDRERFDDAVASLLNTVSPSDLEAHWTDETRGQYTLGYMQCRATSDDELTASEAAEVAGIFRQSLIARIKSGSLPGRQDRHNRWMVRRADLEAWEPDKTGPKK